VTGYRLSVSCSFTTVIATDPVSIRSAEESITGAGSFLKGWLGVDSEDLLEGGSDIGARNLLGGGLDIDSDSFLEELNTGSGFIQIAAWLSLP